MQTYFSAKELAEFKAPSLPASERRIQMRAKDEAWATRRRAGEKTLEYALASLPAAAQAHIQAALCNLHNGTDHSVEADTMIKQAPEAALAADVAAARETLAAEERKALIAQRMEARVAFATKTERTQEKSWARNEVLDACVAWQEARRAETIAAGHKPMGLVTADHLFCLEYNAGRIEVHPATRERVPSLSKASLDRWRERRQLAGTTGLADRYQGRAGAGKVDRDEKLQALIVRQAKDNLHVRVPHILDEMRSQVKEGGLLEHLWQPGMTRKHVNAVLPSASAVRRWLTKLQEGPLGNALDAIKDPDGHRGRRKTAFGNADGNVVDFCQLWELDSTKGDILLADGKRYVVVGCIDVWSRQAKLLVVPTSKAVAIGAMFRKALMDPMWGVPQCIRIDNGSDYISNYMKDLYRDLEIETWVCPPGQPQKKPFIERFFGTFARGLVEFLPGFVGHNVADRKAIESRQQHEMRQAKKRLALANDAAHKLVYGGDLQLRMTPDEFQTFCDRWLNVYHHKEHGALDGLTPFQKRAAWSGELMHVPERALDVLLLEGETRVVGKEGITFGRHTYAAEELDARWRGKPVRIKYDVADAGFLYVFHPDAENGFICKAICPEIVGVSRVELAAKLAAADGRYYTDGKRRLRAMAKQAGDETPYDRILTYYEEIDAKLTLFRGPAAEHSTPMLEAAAAALVDAPAPTPAPDLTADERRRAEAVFSRSVPTEDLFDWERAIYLEEKRESAHGLTPEEAAELERMQRQPGYEFVIDHMGGARSDRRAM
jgi:transposase InsO family protein